MKNALDHNLERLLRRAYEPARPRSAFSAQLLERVLDTVPASRSIWRVSAVVRPVLQGLAAAVLLFVALLGWDRARALPGGHADQLVAAGEVALRVDDGPWFAASSRTIPWLTGTLEAVVSKTAGASALDVLALTGDRIQLGAGAHVRLMARVDGPLLRLDAGQAQLEKAPHSPRWRVLAGGGEIDWDDGRLELDAGAGRAAAGVSVARGRGVLVASGLALAAGSRGSFSAGTWSPEAQTLASAVGPAAGERVTLALAPQGAADPHSAGDPQRPGAAAIGCVVRGHVRSSLRAGEAHTPVRRFRVWLRREVGLPEVSESVCHEVDDGEGAFEIGGLKPGQYSVLVEAEGHAAWRTEGALVGRAELVLDVTLGAGGSLRGYVIDERTDTPVVGALVLGLSDLPQQLVGMHEFIPVPMPHAHAVTDANGAFELQHLSVGAHTLRASHPVHAPSWIGATLLHDGQELELEPLRLGQGGILAGRVERQDGRPLAGAVIVASRIDGDGMGRILDYGVAVTGADGAYSIEHLAAAAYVVMNVAGPLESPAEWSRIQQANIRSGATAHVDFLAEAQARGITGRLLDARGEPIAGWLVTLAQDEPGGDFTGWAATGTGQDGSFEFVGLEAGAHGLYMGRRANDSFIRCRTLEVPLQGQRDYTLRLPDTQIAGTLVDARAGSPVVGDVYLERFDARSGKWSFAGRDIAPEGGAFRFPFIESGRYRMTVVDVPGLANRLSEPIEVEAGEQVAVELALSVGGKLTVLCRDELGRAVRAAQLHLRVDGAAIEPVISSLGSVWVADREGRISVEHLPLLTLRVSVEAPGFVALVKNVTPTTDGSVIRVELRRQGD